MDAHLPKIVELLKASNLIERDGVRALLESNDIKCFTETRDMIAVFGNEMTLSLGAYSSFFDGYKIFVKEEDRVTAERLIQENFPANPVQDTPDYARKFLISCLFSMTVLPVVAHIAAVYHLKKAIQHQQKIRPLYFVAGVIFWSIIPAFAYFSGAASWLYGLKKLMLW